MPFITFLFAYCATALVVSYLADRLSALLLSLYILFMPHLCPLIFKFMIKLLEFLIALILVLGLYILEKMACTFDVPDLTVIDTKF